MYVSLSCGVERRHASVSEDSESSEEDELSWLTPSKAGHQSPSISAAEAQRKRVSYGSSRGASSSSSSRSMTPPPLSGPDSHLPVWAIESGQGEQRGDGHPASTDKRAFSYDSCGDDTDRPGW